MSDSTTALAPVGADALTAPVPTFSGPLMAEALIAYRELQAALDHAMPDQLQTIGDKQFRKKGYWRAVGVAFNLDVELVEERYDERGTFADGRPNFGYLVTYRAVAKGGRAMTGDGSCFAVEKAGRYRCPHPHPSWAGKSEHYPPETCPDYDPEYRWHALPPEASEHNVRAHAHTRAKNRCIADLVAFGEVSAEEVERDEFEPPASGPRPAPTPRNHAPARASSSASASRPASVISEKQVTRFWAIAHGVGWSDAEARDLLTRHGFAHADEVTRDRYDAICKELEAGTEKGGPS